MADIVIRNGTVIDGTGGAPFEADIAIENGRIAAVGKIAARGTEEIDAARPDRHARVSSIPTRTTTPRRPGAAASRRRPGMASPRP